MQNFKTIYESEKRMSRGDINKLEDKLDELFSTIGVDIEFTTHFKNRIRLRKIDGNEIADTFTKLYRKYKNKINNDNFKAIVVDISNYLNIPISVQDNPNSDEKDMFLITIFKSDSDPDRQRLRPDEIIKV